MSLSQQPQTGEYQKPDQGVGGAAKSKKNAPPPPPPPPSEEYDTLETAGLPQTTTTTAAAGGAEYGKLNVCCSLHNEAVFLLHDFTSQPPPGDGKKGKAGRGKAHPPPTAAEYSQLDTTSRSTEGSTAQVSVCHSLPPSLLTSCSCVVPPGGGGVCRAKHRSSLRSTDQSVPTVHVGILVFYNYSKIRCLRTYFNLYILYIGSLYIIHVAV